MEHIIEFRNVSKAFKSNLLFSRVSFSVEKGSVVGFVGQNGSGKSVLFKLISGIYRPDNGSITVRGKELGKDCDFPENMGVLIDSPGFVDIYTGFQNLKYLAAIKNVIGDEKIKQALETVGLDSDSKTRVKNYSLGMRQKLAIAQAIMEDQDILLLDEPFNALDDESHKKMLALVKSLQKAGKTVLITSHNCEDIEYLCDTVYIIKDKQVLLK